MRRPTLASAAAAFALLLAITALPAVRAAGVCATAARWPGPYGAQAARNLTEFSGRVLGALLARGFDGAGHVKTSFADNSSAADGATEWAHYDFAKPFVSCPPPFARRAGGGGSDSDGDTSHSAAPTGGRLVRYGGAGDGGKLLCDLPAALRAPCVVYSLGSRGDFSFEADVLNRTECEVHTFDCTYPNGTSIGPRHHFHHLCIGDPPAPGGPADAFGADPKDFRSLAAVAAMLGHSAGGGSAPLAPSSAQPWWRRFAPLSPTAAAAASAASAAAAANAKALPRSAGPPTPPQPDAASAGPGRRRRSRGIDVLKIDIEGHELPVLAALRPWQRPLPVQIVAEIHLKRRDGRCCALAAAAPASVEQLALLMQHMASLGYGVAAREDNHATDDRGCCAEFTFLRVAAPAGGARRFGGRLSRARARARCSGGGAVAR